MSATDRDRTRTELQVISNEEEETVTFVADYDRDSIVPSTEWITVEADATVDLQDNR